MYFYDSGQRNLKEDTHLSLLNALVDSETLKIVPGINHIEGAVVWMDTVAKGLRQYTLGWPEKGKMVKVGPKMDKSSMASILYL